MNIHLAYVVLLEAEGEDSVAWSILRNGISPGQGSTRFPSRDFPPAGLFSEKGAFQLALVPLVNRTGQLGYVVFGTDHLDLYGSIVQQLAGAFNSARMYREATEGRRLAEEANRMKSRFLSTISHELRTPLNLIVGLSGIMLRGSDEGDSPLPEAARKDVDRIHAYSQHLGGLIGDVIDLATSDAGQLRLNNETLNLSQVLRMVAESGSQLAADKGLAFEASLPETGPWVWGDQTRLRQVALNLINNAIKFTTKGSVRLRLEDHGDSVTVLVSDTGLGISPDEQQVIFDEFRQSDRSVALGYGGLGLGLAICKRLVEMHGGTIAVRSSGLEGAGSTFSFTLPTIRLPLEQPHQSKREQLAQQSIVVLTSQPNTSERLCEELRQRGFRVHITLMKRGLDWRSEINDCNPDAIILDVSTNSALGWETLKEIKSKNQMNGVPVMLFSSSQLDGSLLELDYLTKPIEISELTRALDQQWLMAEAVRPTRTILVVDDEPDTLEMHARIVQAHSSINQVLKARNGKEALDLLHHQIVDLVLLDLQMPEMDGFEVLEAMRGMESLRKIPVIVVTGKNLTETDMARLNQGVATVLSKGLFSIDETIAHISAALENKRRLSGEAQRLVRIAMAYIHENYAGDLSRRAIARHVGIAEDHLTFCFRQELGTTPIEYLQRYRINQAKRLLKETQQTITEIALNVGFSDSGYFGRIFRRETGMTPEAFRRS
jgi:signal transduction histidine kinase/DNA-binding response OmpR family regulator